MCTYSYIQIYIYIYICTHTHTKQKHPRYKKGRPSQKHQLALYSYTQLKSVISGRGQGPSCLLGIM